MPRILLLPIGGMAEFSAIPRQPRRELLITLAGPAVNFTIVLLLLPFVPVPRIWSDAAIELNLHGLGQILLWMNLVMGCFNLLPIFPMDGGRILRALLATRWPYVRATLWAATLGKVLALIGAGLMAFVWQNPLGAILFAFIFIAGDLEYRMVKRREEENAQWEMLISRLYGTPDGRGRDVPANILHGPN